MAGCIVIEPFTKSLKIDGVYSGYGHPNGGIPQGTVTGSQKFLVHINDLQTSCPLYKYVDDETLFEICSATSVSLLQESVDIVSKWIKQNNMIINASKTKEMVICFCKDEHHIENIPRIRIEDIPIERVSHTKVFGVTLSNNLSWNAHVDSIVNKAGKRMYMLFQLKRAGVCQSDLVRIFVTIIRPVV